MDGYVAIMARGNRCALLRVSVVTGTALHAFLLAVGLVCEADGAEFGFETDELLVTGDFRRDHGGGNTDQYHPKSLRSSSHRVCTGLIARITTCGSRIRNCLLKEAHYAILTLDISLP